jgi:predicted dehydrogenase
MAGKINLGVVGCGHIAKSAMLPDAALVEDFNFRAFADIDEEKAKGLCEEFKGEYYTTDLEKLVNDEELDAVLILTLPDLHTPLAIKFLDAGKHVFLQKPVATTYEECRALVQAEKNAKGICMCAFCYRLSPLIAKIKEVMPYPQMQLARMMVPDMANNLMHYIENKATGGPMLELAIHNADMTYYLADAKPVKVSAFGGNIHHPDLDMVDNMVMNIEFANGAAASMVSVDCGANDFTKKWFAEMYGFGNSVIIDGFRTMRVIQGKVAETIEIDYKKGIGLDRDMEAFRDSIIAGKSAIPASEGVVSTIMMLKAYDSIKEGKTLAVDVDAILA